MCCNVLPKRLLLALAVLGLAAGVFQFFNIYVSPAQADAADQPQGDDVTVPAALDFAVKTITEEDTHLSQYYGEVVLIINVASKCGLTPQYKQLQQLHEEHHEAGLSILGFPANNFGRQEPGTNDEIQAFCQQNYGVDFDMFAKISVKGDDQHPLYEYLTKQQTKPVKAGPVGWNFGKFLVGRDGAVIARFSPRTKPNAKEVLEAIEAALKQPVPEDVEAVRALHAPKAEAETEE